MKTVIKNSAQGPCLAPLSKSKIEIQKSKMAKKLPFSKQFKALQR
jgi:hypothetical protein